jgi:hypothetical protein
MTPAIGLFIAFVTHLLLLLAIASREESGGRPFKVLLASTVGLWLLAGLLRPVTIHWYLLLTAGAVLPALGAYLLIRGAGGSSTIATSGSGLVVLLLWGLLFMSNPLVESAGASRMDVSNRILAASPVVAISHHVYQHDVLHGVLYGKLVIPEFPPYVFASVGGHLITWFLWGLLFAIPGAIGVLLRRRRILTPDPAHG